MARPPVSVVMPFAGSADGARAALAVLAGLDVGPGDERILADNAGVLAGAPAPAGVRIVRAAGERSPAHARNAGAREARGDWLLFLDADVTAPADLLDAYLASGEPPAAVGALAGGIDGAAGSGLAARFGAARGFLDADVHLAHPYLPRAASANLLVRREAFHAVGGFVEGVRTAEDTDLCWRLQRAGWRLEARPGARVAHAYRDSVAGLRRQWRGYAAGRAWLARRYPDFRPEPALVRAARRSLARGGRRSAAPMRNNDDRPEVGRVGDPRFALLDVVLGLEELVGFLGGNRARTDVPPSAAAPEVWVLERHAADPAGPGGRVEALARTEPPAPAEPDRVVLYAEDDGLAAAWLAVAELVLTHPRRALGDHRGRATADPPLHRLAPTVRRLSGLPAAIPVRARLDDRAARRILALAGRPASEAR